MIQLLAPAAREILRFAAQGRAWPGGEASALSTASVQSNKIKYFASPADESARVSIDARIIRQALLGGDIDHVTEHVFLGTEKHHDDTGWEGLDHGLYRNSTIVIKGVTVMGELNMLAATVTRPVYFVDCAFPDGLTFEHAICRLLDFRGGVMAHANLHQIEVERTLALQEVQCLNGVNLVGAQIGGTLSFDGSSFEPVDNGSVLDCKGAQVGGSVFLREKVLAEKKCARFHTKGLVDFTGADIGGMLSCIGGRFDADQNNRALNCNGVRVGDSVFLRGGDCHPFHATGEVVFLGARIGGQLDCTRGRFEAGENADGDVCHALGLRQATIVRDLIWLDIGSFHGQLDLGNATVGTLLDEKESWPRTGRKRRKNGQPFEGEFILNGFRYDRLDGKSPTDAKSRQRWLACQPKRHLYLDFQPFAWTQLASLLRADGHEVDARQIAVDREKKRTRMYRHKWMRGGFSYFFHWLGGAIFGSLVRFGYSPFRGVVLSFILICAFGFFYAYEEGNGRFIPAQNESLIYMVKNDTSIPPSGYPAFNSLIYSADLFVPLINLQQSANWQPQSIKLSSDPAPDIESTVSDPNSLKHYLVMPTLSRMLMWFEIALGWMMTAMTGLAFTGILRRE